MIDHHRYAHNLYQTAQTLFNHKLVPKVSHLTALWSERGEALTHTGQLSPRIWEMTVEINY